MLDDGSSPPGLRLSDTRQSEITHGRPRPAPRRKLRHQCVQPVRIAFPAEQFDRCRPAVFISERA